MFVPLAQSHHSESQPLPFALSQFTAVSCHEGLAHRGWGLGGGVFAGGVALVCRAIDSFPVGTVVPLVMRMIVPLVVGISVALTSEKAAVFVPRLKVLLELGLKVRRAVKTAGWSASKVAVSCASEEAVLNLLGMAVLCILEVAVLSVLWIAVRLECGLSVCFL